MKKLSDQKFTKEVEELIGDLPDKMAWNKRKEKNSTSNFQ